MNTQPTFSPNPVCAAVARAIALKQSQHKLAKACGVSQALISKAKIDGRLSARLAIAIHRATDGVVPGSALRPTCGAFRSTFRLSMIPKSGDRFSACATPVDSAPRAAMRYPIERHVSIVLAMPFHTSEIGTSQLFFMSV